MLNLVVDKILYFHIYMLHVLRLVEFVNIHVLCYDVGLHTVGRDTVEPHYNEDLGTMKITLLYQVSHIRVKNKEI